MSAVLACASSNWQASAARNECHEYSVVCLIAVSIIRSSLSIAAPVRGVLSLSQKSGISLLSFPFDGHMSSSCSSDDAAFISRDGQ